MILKTLHRKLHQQVRVRFAPSPTGHLHLGGLRSALYNYIFAKQHEGTFVLRIEDTDRGRIVPGSAKAIEDILSWAKLVPDESPLVGGPYGPYVQSERCEIHRDHASELIESGRAYRCFCSSDRLEMLRKHQALNRQPVGYDGKCRNLSQDDIKAKLDESDGKFAVRFAINKESTHFEDRIFGKRSQDFSHDGDRDPIIMKSDGFPTYHFANVVDDHCMKISHVIRGSEWLKSTAKHVQIYDAFGWVRPQFMHIPLVTMSDGRKMSKRNNECHVAWLADSGYYPLAVLNFLTNIGGGVPKEKQDALELWDIDRLIKEFNFDRVLNNSARLELVKLDIYNNRYIKRLWSESPSIVVNELISRLNSKGIKSELDNQELSRLIEIFLDRIVTLNDLMKSETEFLWVRPSVPEAGLSEPDKAVIREFGLMIEAGTSSTEDMRQLADRHGRKYSELMALLRTILTGRKVGLPLNEILQCLGKKRVLEHVEKLVKN